jgi:hypothetical protein
MMMGKTTMMMGKTLDVESKGQAERDVGTWMMRRMRIAEEEKLRTSLVLLR